MSRVSPGSPSQWIATWSPWPASTCRSTQLTATLSRPPTNHFANGASDQSSAVSHGCAHSQLARLLLPEGDPVGGGLVVRRRGGVGLGGELRRRREGPVLVRQVLRWRRGSRRSSGVRVPSGEAPPGPGVARIGDPGTDRNAPCPRPLIRSRPWPACPRSSRPWTPPEGRWMPCCATRGLPRSADG